MGPDWNGTVGPDWNGTVGPHQDWDNSSRIGTGTHQDWDHWAHPHPQSWVYSRVQSTVVYSPVSGNSGLQSVLSRQFSGRTVLSYPGNSGRLVQAAYS